MSLAILYFVFVVPASVHAIWFPRITPTPSFSTPAPPNEPCGLAPETGRCKALKPMYYFDASVDMCKSFNYGGCGGNANKFETKGLCEYVCKEHSCLKLGCYRKACTTQTCPNHPKAICFAVCECWSVWILDGEDVSNTCYSNSS
ncbi:kunitz-type serine protease inhibitor Bt-KTI-like [Crassostrea angulata]|uniref:kunitz-type serine protease inhibitor Bt-KTI-like n=1 Tax=Magallana angulata TaxID=2784310 RepID=UPI0022B113F6|nr:kunitz-type serine protease inhibitor Bt-KTI-like [Crassostrea angulata]